MPHCWKSHVAAQLYFRSQTATDFNVDPFYPLNLDYRLFDVTLLNCLFVLILYLTMNILVMSVGSYLC